MHAIHIPETAEAYIEDVHERAFPDASLAQHDFYKRLIGWVIDERSPLLYQQDHSNEYANFSINCNWLLQRDYSQTAIGEPDTIKTLYGLHEFTHMTHRLPTRLDRTSASEYAEDFTRSEYRASNETEILVHYRVPEVRRRILPHTTIAYDLLRDRGIAQPSSKLLAALRPIIVEHTVMDGIFGDDPAAIAVRDRFKRFNGNRQWASERFAAIRPFFTNNHEADSSGLTDDEYEAVITDYDPHLSQDRYEANVIRNVRFGYMMCGLAVPAINDFSTARHAAENLEGHHAIVQS